MLYIYHIQSTETGRARDTDDAEEGEKGDVSSLCVPPSPCPRVAKSAYHTIFIFHFPRLNNSALAIASSENATRDRPKDAVRGRARNSMQADRPSGISNSQKINMFRYVGVQVSPAPLNAVFEHHPESIERKAISDDVQRARAVPQNLGLLCENPDDLIREQPEQ